MKNKIFLLFFLLPCFCLFAENRDSTLFFQPSSFEKFIERIKYSKSTKNQNKIEISYGFSNLDYPEKAIISNFSNIFLLEFRYGFVRAAADYNKSGFSYLASETAYLANYSSHLSSDGFTDGGKTIDSWQFGFDFSNGFGYSNQFGKSYFIHSGGLGWVVIDFENLGESSEEQKLYDLLDREFLFGTDYETGLRHCFNNTISMDLLYRHSLFFPEYSGLKFFGSYLSELILQRTIDYFCEELIQVFPQSFPILNWTTKSLVSAIFYELKRNEMYSPLESNPSINFDGMKLGISLTFQ